MTAGINEAKTLTKYISCECKYNLIQIKNGIIIIYLIGEKKTGHKINRVNLLVGGNFSHFHIKLVTFPQLNFRF